MTTVIAIVGAGPRGVSVIERIAAYLNTLEETPDLAIHLIDDAYHGAGRIWDTTQTQTLCMNTLAGAVTLFTEPGSSVGAPVVEGPVHYEWIRLLLGKRDEVSSTKTQLFDSYRPLPAVREAFAEELAATRPESNPSRALYGAYIEWTLHVAESLLPKGVEVFHHFARLESITPGKDVDILALSDSSTVEAAATVLASGWVRPGFSAAEETLAAAGGTWVRPDNPVEQPIDAVPESGEVLVRGLGMGFFDVMALVTIDRGGRFIEDPSARSGLRYEASGREPHLVVSSGRGYPYLPKSEYHSLPPAPVLARLKRTIASLRAAGKTKLPAGSIDFGVQLWPAIVQDTYEAYYRTLAAERPEALHASVDAIVETIDAVKVETVASSGSLLEVPERLSEALAEMTSEPFDLTEWIYPLLGFEGTREELTARIGDGLARDISEAVAARRSPIKNALWEISAARKPSSILGSEGRFTWESRAGAFNQFMALGSMVGSGPPLFRTRQLLALVDAGLVSFLGARPGVAVDGDDFILTSGDREARAGTLVDAWMHSPDIRRAEDPLTAGLVSDGRLRPFADNGHPTGSPEVDPATRRTVNADGTLDPRLHVIGIPTYAQLPDTTISPMPGTDPLMLQETDKTAASLLRAAGIQV